MPGDISFFKDKIQQLDFNILQIAFYINNLYLNKNKSEGDRIKNEAILRYGDLARNIINLYSTGYFQNTIKPLYEILEESRDPEYKENFLKCIESL